MNRSSLKDETVIYEDTIDKRLDQNSDHSLLDLEDSPYEAFKPFQGGHKLDDDSILIPNILDLKIKNQNL